MGGINGVDGHKRNTSEAGTITRRGAETQGANTRRILIMPDLSLAALAGGDRLQTVIVSSTYCYSKGSFWAC